jgi:hypothetical protein
MSDSIVRQDTRFTATNPINPRLQIIIVHERNSAREILVAFDFTETMSPAIGASRIGREHTMQQALLNFGWLMQGPLKTRPRWQAATDPE